jgi:hypothetical protein
MLQIVTKKFFRDGVPLHTRPQRRVLYTNRLFLHPDVIALPVGELAPSNDHDAPAAVTATVIEHLEAQELDGSDAMLISTGGEELVDQLADVLSFALDAVFTRDRSRAARLVPPRAGEETSTSKLFRRTFSSGRVVTEAEIEDLRAFETKLLALRRAEFEQVMRAIRRMVRAQQRAADDPTLAYVDLVAALESLSDSAPAPPFPWDRMDSRKRRLIDTALQGVDHDHAQAVRRAVVEAERAGATRRFLAFVTDHISVAYYRDDAVGAVRPPRAIDLEGLLKVGYAIRSRSVHSLVGLPEEAWVLSDGADTVVVPGRDPMLTLEGLSRLARHVIRQYVDRAPEGTGEEFNWRAALPGLIQAHLAPQYWLWQHGGFDHDSAERYLTGFIEHLVGLERSEPIADLTGVLEAIEQQVRGLQVVAARSAMLAIYLLWHRVTAADLHRPDAEAILALAAEELAAPGIIAFAVSLLVGPTPDWTVEQWTELAAARVDLRRRRRHLQLPRGFDAALHVMTAERLLDEGRPDEANTAAARAAEELPGCDPLIAWEQAIQGGEAIELDLHAVAFGKPAPTDEGATGEASTTEPSPVADGATPGGEAAD